ncbi:MAG TPA: DoxX family membrane protein [Vicinamibacterales bacterium]|nr:DoxX family membrane protein [Vicinamibacterales bacterium]
MAKPVLALTGTQQTLLVVLRTLIGWHLAYEGYFKLLHPAWSRSGNPIERFTSIGYLNSSGGPLGELFRVLASPSWAPWLDTGVPLALLVAGLLLMLGFFTQLGCALALLLLATFYLSAIPLQGFPEPHAEGTYLIVNKNLIEAAAVCVLLAFRTGRIAGLDCLRGRATPAPLRTEGAAA